MFNRTLSTCEQAPTYVFIREFTETLADVEGGKEAEGVSEYGVENIWT